MWLKKVLMGVVSAFASLRARCTGQMKVNSFELLAAKVIPIPRHSEHNELEHLARALLAAVMRKLWDRHSARFDRLHYYIATVKTGELKRLLQDTPSQEVQGLFVSGKEKHLAGARAIATYHIEVEMAKKLEIHPLERTGLSGPAARLLARFGKNNGQGRSAK